MKSSLKFTLIILPVLMLGCGGPSLGKPVEVSGTLRMDGEGVANVRVTFFNQEGGVPSEYRSFSGETDQSGNYTISRVYPGTYTVMLYPVDTPDAAEEDAPAEEEGPLAQYTANSPLTAEVSGTQTTFDFDLPSSR